MKFASKIFIFCLYIQNILTCSKGCLKCDQSSEQCLFCDFTNKYFLEQGTCIQKEIEFCEKYSHDFKCIQCQNKYYVQDNLCIAFQGEIVNCEIYKNSTECQYCKTGFYFNQSECIPVESEIMNCKYYSPNGKQCEVCEVDTFLYIDKQYCIYLDTFEGCGIWSQITCQNCIDNYFYDTNSSLIEYFKNINSEMTFLYMNTIINKQQNDFLVKSCQKSSVENCSEFQNVNQCIKCKKGYILVNNICYQSLSNNFQTCSQFNDDSVCVNCKQGFYLKNGSCQSVDKIQNCVSYDTQANISLCIKCNDIYFLDQNKNQCVKRKNSFNISECLSLKFNLDQCEICNEGFQITDDGLKCLQIIQDCVEYKTSTIYSQILRCKKCNDKKYLDINTQTCTEGSTANCQIYQDFYNECKICEQGFYLNQNKQCVAHSLRDIFQCEQFSNTRDNYCEKCNNNSIRITNRNFCRQIVNQIANCEKYKTETTCKTCQKGYRLTVDKIACEPIPIQNCKVFQNDTTCLKCFNYEIDELSIPYEMSQDKSECLIPSMIEFQNCNQVNFDNQHPYCHACIQNYYPKQLPQNHRICVPTDFWKLVILKDQAYLNACEIFDYLDQQCLKCKDGKLLSQGQCVDACPVNEGYFLREISKEYYKNIYMLKRQHFCDAMGSLANCEIFDYSGKSQSNYYSGEPFFGCVKCKQGFKAILNPADETIHGQYTIYNTDESRSGFANRFSFITKCVAEADVLSNLLDVDASVDNCDYFAETDDLKYGCIGCSFGYSGIHFERNDYQFYYIKQCVLINGCENGVFHRGLFNPFNQAILKYSFSKIPLNFYATCHQCTNTTHMVFYGISGGGVHNDNSLSVPLGYISKYSLTTEPPYVGNDAAQTICAEPPAEFNIPQNCGVVQVVVDYQRKGYELVNGQYEALFDSGFVCASCKPGFAPGFQSSGKIISCTEILNCEQKMFNNCYKCATGFVFDFSDLEKKVLQNNCVENQLITNCYSGLLKDSVFYCRKCQQGFVLNLDGKCDQVDIQNCSQQSFIESFALTTTNPRIQEPYEQLLLNNSSGCILCDSGYIATTLEENYGKQFCIKNLELAETDNIQSDSYVKNCLKNYYEPSEGKIRCLQCAENLLLVSGLCIEIQISEEVLSQVGECEIFNYYTRRCDKCKVGYFLNAGVCYKGFIPNCQEFESINKCTRCVEGYVVLTLNSEKAICFEIHQDFNCSEWSQEASSIGELQCNKCIDGFFEDYNNFNIPPFLCFEINAVENCAVHDIRYDIKVSTFNCLKCQDEFYLISNFCIPRVMVDQCKEYYIDQDKCKNCQQGYVLNDQNQCIPSLYDELMTNPCEIFFDQGFCLKCSPGYYLNESVNSCQEVLKSNKVLNCLYYRSKNECETCVTGYYLQDDSCINAVARNCLTYQSIKKCKDCPDGYGYLQDGINLHCEKIQLENCREHNPDVFYPFQCLICDQHFFLDENGVCQPVSKVIQYCEIYQDEFHCQQCEKQKALSESKDGCFSSLFILSKTDEFCHQSLLQSVPQCQLCSFGHYFKDGKCQQCNIRTPQLGCMQCNPYDEQECLICMPGFYQNVKGSCIKIFQQVQDEGVEEFGSVLKVISLLIFLILC